MQKANITELQMFQFLGQDTVKMEKPADKSDASKQLNGLRRKVYYIYRIHVDIYAGYL